MTGPGLKKNKNIFQNMLLVLGWLGLDRSRRLFIAALCSSHPYIQQCTQVTQQCTQIIHIYTVHSSYYTANGHCSQCSTLSDTGLGLAMRLRIHAVHADDPHMRICASRCACKNLDAHQPHIEQKRVLQRQFYKFMWFDC